MKIPRYKLLGCVILLTGAGFAARSIFGANSHLGFVLGVMVMLGLLALAFADWRQMDEVSREAHKTAAVWGVAIGLTVWAISMSALMLGLGPDYEISFSGHQGSLAIFVVGGLAATIPQAACSLLGLAGWWISRR